MITLPIQINKLRQIIHIADIHIRLFNRHDEYKVVFDELYKQIKNVDLSDTIICVAGDIVHAKTDLSPEAISLASDFLRNLANIAPTLVIAGNHDLNLANKNRLDALSPIIQNINHPHLFYLRDSGVYTIGDTDMAVLSVVDGKAYWPAISDLHGVKKVALYHGSVYNSQTDIGYRIIDKSISIDTFAGYDYVILGDIHQHQILSNSKPLMAYASSLIQQSHGENITGHGFCIWDLELASIKFVPINNPFGYYTVLVDNNLAELDYTDLPKNTRLRIFAKNTSDAEITKILSVIKTKTNVIETSINKLTNYNFDANMSQQKYDFSDIRVINNQNNLIYKYLQTNYTDIDQETLSDIGIINAKLNEKLKDNNIKSIRWMPIKFEFSNMFSYGENNVIDFTNYSGIYGLFGDNASGKSSLFDSLMFCIFDKTPRTYRGENVMNNRKNSFSSHLEFEMDNEVYHIERTGKRKKDGTVKVDVDFWKITKDNNRTDLNGEERRVTNQIIRSYLGTYEDFILTNFSVQNNNASFIDKPQAERKDLLMQLLGLNFFDELYTLASEESKQLEYKIKSITSKDCSSIIANTQEIMNRALADKAKYEAEITQLEVQVAEFRTAIESYQNSKRPVVSKYTDYNKLESLKNSIVAELAKQEKDKGVVETDIENLTNIIKDNKNSLSLYPTIEDDILQYNTLKQNKESYVKELKSLNILLNNLRNQIDIVTKLEYDPNCVFCVKTNKQVLTQADTAKISLENTLASIKALELNLTDANTKLQQMGNIENTYIKYKQYLKNISDAESNLHRNHLDLNKYTIRIVELTNKLLNIDEEIVRYKNEETAIEHNKQMDIKIDEIQKRIQAIEGNIKALHNNKQSEAIIYETQKHQQALAIKSLEELAIAEKSNKAYSVYLKALNRDGIPYYLISKVIPIIEQEVNAILSQVVDFTIRFEMDGKNINASIMYGDDRIWPIELSSGMERFVSSLAIRIAMTSISNLPKSNFLIIDEGFGALKAENLQAMSLVFTLLKNQFKFIFVISHIDMIRDMVEKIIEIKFTDGFSTIQ